MLQPSKDIYHSFPLSHIEPPFSDDVCSLILEFLDWREIIKTCPLISSQFYMICGSIRYGISLPRFKLSTDEILNLGSCPTIQHATCLDLSGNEYVDEVAISNIELVELKVLNVAFTPIRNPAIVFEKFKHLVELDMRGIFLDRECVESISKCAEMKLTSFSFQACSNVDDILLMSCKAMKNLTYLYCGAISHEAIIAMCENMNLKQLKMYGIDNRAIETISTSSNMSKLETLILLRHLIDGIGLVSLSQSKVLKNLTELNISGFNPPLDPFKKLMESENLKSLKLLQVNLTRLTADHLKAIADNLSQLTCLEVHGSNIKEDGIKILSSSPAMSNLTELRATSNQIGIGGLESLSESLHITNLKSLQYFGSITTSTAIECMCLSANFTNLTDISFSGITNEGIRSITESIYITKLEKLHLCNGLIDSRGCEMLAMCENMKNLKFLIIGSNPLGDMGVHLLVNSPFITKLLDLDLFSVGMTDEAVKSIVESNNLNHLEKLFIPSNQITDVGAELLSNAKNLRKLKGLHYRNNKLMTQKGKEALLNSATLKRCNIKLE